MNKYNYQLYKWLAAMIILVIDGKTCVHDKLIHVVYQMHVLDG